MLEGQSKRMSRLTRQCRLAAFTKWELVFVIAVLLMLVFLVMTWMAGKRSHSPRIDCVNNLKAVGMAARVFAYDHEEKFPWQVPVKQGGSMEFFTASDVFRHFQVMSNELPTPKVLVCAGDKERRPAKNWTKDFKGNERVSYFVGLDARAGSGEWFLSGDRNISGQTILTNGMLLSTKDSGMTWTNGNHGTAGNIGFADGSVMQMSRGALTNWFQSAVFTTNRLAIP
jgi:prepilin-type processing-associated H-X9-DG protein